MEKCRASPQTGQMDILHAAHSVGELFYHRYGLCGNGGCLTLANDDHFIRLGFRHDFHRMGGYNHLRIATAKITNQPTLQVRVHIHIRFIQYDRMAMSCAGQKPHGLEPHLKPVSHSSYLTDKPFVSDIEDQGFIDLAHAYQFLDLHLRPGFRYGLLECFEQVVVYFKLISKMKRGQ